MYIEKWVLVSIAITVLFFVYEKIKSDRHTEKMHDNLRSKIIDVGSAVRGIIARQQGYDAMHAQCLARPFMVQSNLELIDELLADLNKIH